jgi:hypothetical protein
MAIIQELRAAVQLRKNEYEAIVDTGTRAEVAAANQATKDAQTALIDALTAGAKPCPTSGLPPTALVQDDEKFGELVEIGSRVVPHYRARGIDQESAVRRWNEGCKEIERRKLALPEADRSKPLVTVDGAGRLVGLPASWYAPKARK